MTHLVQSGRCALLACAALLAPPCAVAATAVIGDLPRAADRPLESLPGVDTEYGELRIGGDTRLRTIVTRATAPASRDVCQPSLRTVAVAIPSRRPTRPMDGRRCPRLITEAGVLWQRWTSRASATPGTRVLR
jgi:hypothetical protein